MTKADVSRNKVNLAIVQENGTLPIHKEDHRKLTEVPLIVFLLLPKACSKKKAAYQGCTQVMSLTQMHIS